MGSGSGSGSGSLNCADQATQFGCLFCQLAQQCTPPYTAQDCAACGSGFGSGSGGFGMCTGGMPDGMCDSMESNATCPLDCM